MQQKIRIDIFVAAFILLSFIALAGFIVGFAQSDAGMGSHAMAGAMTNSATGIFPLVLLSGLLKNHSLPVVMLLLAVNILFYATILAVIFQRMAIKLKNYKPFTISFYVLAGILVFSFAFVTFLIIRIFS